MAKKVKETAQGKSCDTCPRQAQCEQEKMDLLFQVMDNENDIMVTDGDGVVLRISDSYEQHFFVKRADVVGKRIGEIVQAGVISEAVTEKVLQTGRKQTILQTNRHGEQILTTGVPLFHEDGTIRYVVSFNAVDIAGTTDLQAKYDQMTALMEAYSAELRRLQAEQDTEAIVFRSEPMQRIDVLITQIAATDANVLITGETGVGKNQIARRIHRISHRADGPFVEINCGTIPASLIESELFGYEKGSFTGAGNKGKMGKIELAKGGTLFLDEIGELPLELQAKLLQVIQEKKLTRVGGLQEIHVDFRLITATNVDLTEAIRLHRFREDLYYRLNVIHIDLPPLRERRADIIPLLLEFTTRFNKRYHRNVVFSPASLEMLEQVDWPGNIRQLENFVERTVVTAAASVVKPEDLPLQLQQESTRPIDLQGNTLGTLLEGYERDILMQAYERFGSSIEVGKALGISQTTAARKLRKYIPGYARDARAGK